MWLLLGVYNTQERLFKMKKVKSASCIICQDSDQIENRVHFLLLCSGLADIREDFVHKLKKLSSVVDKHIEASAKFLVCLLDPYSPMVHEDLRASWESEVSIYKWSRDFCFAMHNRRTKILELITGTE